MTAVLINAWICESFLWALFWWNTASKILFLKEFEFHLKTARSIADTCGGNNFSLY